MINHISIGVRDLRRSKVFYDATLAPVGYACLSESADRLGYGTEYAIDFWVGLAKRPVPADMESGLHICFTARSKDEVAAFHEAALHEGGEDNGPPGPRPAYGEHYYAAFLIDPDGYRLEAYFNDV
jgi:catechol 2,3-dioxygenase-like lactoylglutathione lyase family enzyme